MISNRRSQRNLAEQQGKTIVGVFDDHQLAGEAVAELGRAGFGNQQIGVALPNERKPGEWTSGQRHAPATARRLPRPETRLPFQGGTLDAGVRVLVPDGTADSSVSPCGTAPAGTTLVGDLLGAGASEREAKYYRTEFDAGRAIVAVAAGVRACEARAILRRHGSYNMIYGIFTNHAC